MKRKILSWSVAVAGILLGFSVLVVAGCRWLPNFRDETGWRKEWVFAAGWVLFGLTFLVASIVATRNRRRAGLIFLSCAPIIAFCFSVPDTGWDREGNGIFYSPSLSSALGLAALFFAPFVAALLSKRHRKRALVLFLGSAAVVTPIFARSQWTVSLLPPLAGWTALVALVAWFWLGTRKWPSLTVTPPPRPLRTKLAVVLLACAVILIADISSTFVWTALTARFWMPDCSGPILFAKPLFPDHTVLTARLIHVGHKREISGRWAGLWAIGRVQEQFWGVPPLAHRFVLLTNRPFWEGDTFFIDGTQARGLLTRFLPIVEGRPCGRTSPLSANGVEMRVLHEGEPTHPRILGYVRAPEKHSGDFFPRLHTPMAGMRITITGSSGSRVATTDDQGIYEVDDVQPDSYKVNVTLPDTQAAHERDIRKFEFDSRKLVEADFDVSWNGTIEGTVTDPNGVPIQAMVEVKNPDGTDVQPIMLGDTRQDGSFRIDCLPAGRYVLLANAFPREGSPYLPQYFPAASGPKDAHVFELAEGQHIKNVNCILTLAKAAKR